MTEIPTTINIEGKLTQSWPEYKLATYQLSKDGSNLDNESQAVIRDGKHIRSFSSRYQILPNEVAIEKAQEFTSKIVDDQLGKLKPYEADGIGRYSNLGVTKDTDMPNIYWNQDKTIVNCLYEFEKPFSPDNRDVYLGLCLTNSINGFCPFSTFAHTFRPYCENVFWHMIRSKVIEGVQGLTLESGDKVAGDMRGSKLSRVVRKHTKSLDVSAIDLSIESSLEMAFNVIEDYNALQEKMLSQKQAEAIFSNLPKRLTSQLDTVEFKDDKVKIIGEPSQWEAFNDITHKISHGTYQLKKDGKNFVPKFESVSNYMKHTQSIFNLR